MTERKIRVLIANPVWMAMIMGQKWIARAFMDAGMEVIYTGLRQTPEMIAEALLQERCGCRRFIHPFGCTQCSGTSGVEKITENGLGRCKVFLGRHYPQE